LSALALFPFLVIIRTLIRSQPFTSPFCTAFFVHLSSCDVSVCFGCHVFLLKLETSSLRFFCPSPLVCFPLPLLAAEFFFFFFFFFFFCSMFPCCKRTFSFLPPVPSPGPFFLLLGDCSSTKYFYRSPAFSFLKRLLSHSPFVRVPQYLLQFVACLLAVPVYPGPTPPFWMDAVLICVPVSQFSRPHF